MSECIGEFRRFRGSGKPSCAAVTRLRKGPLLVASSAASGCEQHYIALLQLLRAILLARFVTLPSHMCDISHNHRFAA